MRFALLALLVAAPVAGQDSPAPVSAGTAYRMSLLGTVLPVATAAAILVAQGGGTHDRTAPALLITTGLLFGPHLGYGAAGLGGRGFRGTCLRAGLGLATLAASFGICGMDCSPNQDEANVASYVAVAGLALIAADAAYDVSQLRHNIRRRAERRLGVTPVYLPGERQLGLGLHYAF